MFSTSWQFTWVIADYQYVAFLASSHFINLRDFVVLPKSYPPIPSDINKNYVDWNSLKFFCNTFVGNHIGVDLKTETKILKYNNKFHQSAERMML